LLVTNHNQNKKVAMNQILIKNATLITMDPQRRVIEGGALLIENDRIISLSSELPEENPEIEVFDARDRIIIPGLINTHVHVSQQLARGLGDDVELIPWIRDRILPMVGNETDEDSYFSTLLFGIEQIHSGCTTFAEAGAHRIDAVARAVSTLGIRGVISRFVATRGSGVRVPPSMTARTVDEILALQEKEYDCLNGMANGRVRYWFEVSSILNNTDQCVIRTKKLADSHGVGIHMHISETKFEADWSKKTLGRTPVEHLEHLGFLDRNLLGVHCVWLTDHELDLLAEHEVKVSHDPAAAMRYLGFAKIPEMVQRGIMVSIGTDGAPSNNRMSMVDEMWLTSLIHKGRTLDCTVLPAHEILDMGTINGARCLLWDDEIGSLESGKKADLVIINPNTANMLPVHDVVINIVTAMKTENIESVMADGKWLMRDHKILVVDEEEVKQEAVARAYALKKRVGIVLPEREWGEPS
jgi:5-methylthioadenosine/S-adenosylhomocysteine deaminase